MHILIDVQGLQSESKYRGIGRSTLSMSRAIIRNAGNHRVSILINGMYPIESIQEVRHLYRDVLQSDEIFIFSGQGPVAASDTQNSIRNRAAKISRDVAIANIHPDIVFVISFFEGHGDDYVVSVPDYPVSWKTVCVCHDLIPLLNQEFYLRDANFRQFYLNKLTEYQHADAIFAISESAAEEVKTYVDIDPAKVVNISSAVDPEFRVIEMNAAARKALNEKYGLPAEFILTLAMIEPRKNIEGLIHAFSMLSPDLRNRYPLVLACKIRPFELARTKELIESYRVEPQQIIFTGYLPDDDLIALYNTCKIFVFPSFHEGFGLPPLEAMSCGAATLCSNATSLPEVMGWQEAMFDPNDISAIKSAMERALTDDSFYQRLKSHALTQAALFSWDRTALLALEAFEAVLPPTPTVKFEVTDAKAFTKLSIDRVKDQCAELNDVDKLGVAWSLARNCFGQRRRQLLVDASVLVEHDARTGIQRVVRSILSVLLTEGVPGYDVRPVYCRPDERYHYANRYQAEHFGVDYGPDEPVLFLKDDVMVVVDLTAHLFPHIQPQLDFLRRAGAQVHFVIHDIIPIYHPQWSIEGIQRLFPLWLRGLSEHADGIVTVSRSVADDVRQWLREHPETGAKNPYLTVKNFHLGADLEASMPTKGLPENADLILNSLSQAPSFLMVSTIEPRKAHEQVLQAFEIFWQQGRKLNLVLVGKEGWNVEALCKKMRKHPQLNRQLFWLSDISDEFLVSLYQHASALVIPSYAEGFGLPLIEAAQKKLPLIVRDIPVFREIAGDHAFYFSGEGGEVVCDAIDRWLRLKEQDAIPDSAQIPWLTWRQSAQFLLKQLPLLAE